LTLAPGTATLVQHRSGPWSLGRSAGRGTMAATAAEMRGRRGRLHRRGQGGFTLLEAVVSLGLVSGVVLALAGGLLTSVKSSQAAKETQEIDTALSVYTEGFKALQPGMCPPLTSTTVLGYDAEVTMVESAEPIPTSTSTSTTAPLDWESTCTNEHVPYRLSVTLTDGDGSSVSGQVVVATTTTTTEAPP
jgi:type II secretory pathway pseudopilin PulG